MAIQQPWERQWSTEEIKTREVPLLLGVVVTRGVSVDSSTAEG